MWVVPYSMTHVRYRLVSTGSKTVQLRDYQPTGSLSTPTTVAALPWQGPRGVSVSGMNMIVAVDKRCAKQCFMQNSAATVQHSHSNHSSCCVQGATQAAVSLIKTTMLHSSRAAAPVPKRHPGQQHSHRWCTFTADVKPSASPRMPTTLLCRDCLDRKQTGAKALGRLTTQVPSHRLTQWCRPPDNLS